MDGLGRCRSHALVVVALLLLLGACSAEDAAESSAAPEDAPTASAPTPEDRESSASTDRTTGTPEPEPTASRSPRGQATTKAAPLSLVARVIDGDTVELGNGQTVRLVGIDTPERGECGFDQATDDLADLVQGKTVQLTRSDENTDRYGRLLRYVDVGEQDAGLRLIKNGRAIARYDSRDGYGFHPREPRYVAADDASPRRSCAPEPAPPAAQLGAGDSCAPGYTPCVPPYPPDVNCADVGGPVAVTGSDPHGLDADGDGTACES